MLSINFRDLARWASSRERPRGLASPRVPESRGVEEESVLQWQQESGAHWIGLARGGEERGCIFSVTIDRSGVRVSTIPGPAFG